MIVHGSSLSPFVRKTLVFAAEKGIAVENKPGRFGDRSPEWLAKSPFAKIPALEDGDYTLSDSSAIIHYLEAKHPEPALIPAEPQARGKVIWFEEFADTLMFAALAPIFFNRVVAPMLGLPNDPAVADKAEAEALPPVLDYLEGALRDDGYLVGDGLTLADIAVASPFVNALHGKIVIDTDRYPKVNAFRDRMIARSSFATLVEAERKLTGI